MIKSIAQSLAANATALALMPTEVLNGTSISSIAKAVLAAFAMTGALWLMDRASVPWVHQLVIASFVYGGAILLLRVFQSNELMFFRRFVTIRSLKNVIIPSEGVSA